MFADFAKIYIKSGKGGDGHVSFRRELYVANGGPNGGDGGKGGDVIFEVDKGLNTLYEFRHTHNYKAQAGEEGGKQNKTGKNGADLIIKVPEGTIIREAEVEKTANSDEAISHIENVGKNIEILKSTPREVFEQYLDKGIHFNETQLYFNRECISI